MNPAISCSAVAGALLILALSGCQQQQQAAELVLRGGMIYTVTADQPMAEAIVVSAGKIVFVGDEATAAAYIGPDTEVVDLEGRLLLPGLIDAHLHPLGGAVKELYQCNFPFSADPDLIRETMADCVENRPNAVWITGGQWDSGFFERFEMLSPRSFLDEVSGDAAIVLSDDSGHNAWVNSKALELAEVFA
ncbi:MAG TPA: amidohydrolase, partial [Gammaproteobacteria bacterium]|nr:amidohydrolase [Gammaproteobacteria bacterium]